MTPHAEWLRLSELFSVLKGLSFFRQWRIRTVRASILLGCPHMCAVFAAAQLAGSECRCNACRARACRQVQLTQDTVLCCAW
jgi:hypothetical protein